MEIKRFYLGQSLNSNYAVHQNDKNTLTLEHTKTDKSIMIRDYRGELTAFQVVQDKDLLIGGSEYGELKIHNLAGVRPYMWKKPKGDTLYKSFFYHNGFLFQVFSNTILKMDPYSGEQSGQFSLSSGFEDLCFIKGDKVYFLNQQRHLTYLDLSTGREKTLNTLEIKSIVYLSEDKNQLYFKVKDEFWYIDLRSLRKKKLLEGEWEYHISEKNNVFVAYENVTETRQIFETEEDWYYQIDYVEAKLGVYHLRTGRKLGQMRKDSTAFKLIEATKQGKLIIGVWEDFGKTISVSEYDWEKRSEKKIALYDKDYLSLEKEEKFYVSGDGWGGSSLL